MFMYWYVSCRYSIPTSYSLTYRYKTTAVRAQQTDTDDTLCWKRGFTADVIQPSVLYFVPHVPGISTVQQ